MRLRLTSIIVDDQDRAERFYTGVLGFRKKQDFPAGGFRWLTVVSPDGPDELELALEPNAHPAAQSFQEAMLESGMPLAALETEDIARDFERLSAAGVVFTQEPTDMGPASFAVFADTCGNLIQLYEPKHA